MRQVASRTDVFGPSAGVSYTSPNQIQSNTQTQTAPVSVVSLFGNLQSSFLAQPVVWMAGAIVALVLWAIIEHRAGHEVAHIRISVRNWVVAGLLVMTFFAVAKIAATKYDVPGLSKFVLYATGGAA